MQIVDEAKCHCYAYDQFTIDYKKLTPLKTFSCDLIETKSFGTF